MIDVRFTHVWTQLGAHVHDISVTALALAVATLGVVLLLELRSVLRLRYVVDNQLGRIFEQLDLLSFETQQLLEAQHAVRPLTTPVEPPTINAVVLGGIAGIETRAGSPVVRATTSPAASLTASPAAGAAAEVAPAAHGALSGRVYQNVAALAATGASSREIAERLGLASGEARLLSSLAQARARRAESASA